MGVVVGVAGVVVGDAVKVPAMFMPVSATFRMDVPAKVMPPETLNELPTVRVFAVTVLTAIAIPPTALA